MAYRNFTEKEVRKAILKKAAPTIVNKSAPHWRVKYLSMMFTLAQ